MMSKAKICFAVLSILSVLNQVFGRERWLERDNRSVNFRFARRHFGWEQPTVLQKLSSACPAAVCGPLALRAATPLLAVQPECSQQDMADAIIDASKMFDTSIQTNMLEIAIAYRQLEKNTPLDFTTNPPSARNSVFCQTAPNNTALYGLVQAQDPANDPDLFFDPSTGATVKRGVQANTAPFNGTATTNSTVVASAPVISSFPDTYSTDLNILGAQASVTSCSVIVTVTVSGSNPAATMPNAITVSYVGPSVTSASTPAATGSVSIGNFGTCSIPQIKFGVGFDGRTETSFEPVDQTSYNHGSADDIDIITQFICDTLTNSCNADQTAKDTCATATIAADAATPKTGAQADAFNAVFGIKTDFAAVAAINDQGVVSDASSSVAPSITSPVITFPVSVTLASVTTATSVTAPASITDSAIVSVTASATSAPPASSAATAASAIGNFGKCSVPQIQFGVGFDSRKETSFEPVDQSSFSHGSADNIDIITQFICNELDTPCGADQTAKDTCAAASKAADAAAAQTGAQADAFNAAFGIQTDFAAVAVVDNQGNIVATSAATPSA